jgi:hypothetical protein
MTTLPDLAARRSDSGRLRAVARAVTGSAPVPAAAPFLAAAGTASLEGRWVR